MAAAVALYNDFAGIQLPDRPDQRLAGVAGVDGWRSCSLFRQWTCLSSGDRGAFALARRCEGHHGDPRAHSSCNCRGGALSAVRHKFAVSCWRGQLHYRWRGCVALYAAGGSRYAGQRLRHLRFSAGAFWRRSSASARRAARGWNKIPGRDDDSPVCLAIWHCRGASRVAARSCCHDPAAHCSRGKLGTGIVGLCGGGTIVGAGRK